MRSLALGPLILLCACAGPGRRGEAGPPGPPPGLRLPRSSVAAVILRAERLGLDAAQVDALQLIDDELARRLEAELPQPSGADGQRPPSEGGSASGIAESGGGGRGGPGGGVGGMGGPPGGGMGGPPGGGRGGGPGGGPGGGKPVAPGVDLEARLDELDTRAFLRAEAVLRPEQREEAREIASDYRAKRYDLRQSRRKRR